MAFGSHVKYRDERTGQYRKARDWEKNRHFQVDTLSEGVANFAFRTANRMADIAGEFAEDLLNYARENAPWEDRTGEARRGLEYEVSLYNQSLEVDLFHTVEYGIYLEVRWGAKYAIIIPTVETMGPKLFDKMNGILGDIQYYD